MATASEDVLDDKPEEGGAEKDKGDEQDIALVPATDAAIPNPSAAAGSPVRTVRSLRGKEVIDDEKEEGHSLHRGGDDSEARKTMPKSGVVAERLRPCRCKNETRACVMVQHICSGCQANFEAKPGRRFCGNCPASSGRCCYCGQREPAPLPADCICHDEAALAAAELPDPIEEDDGSFMCLRCDRSISTQLPDAERPKRYCSKCNDTHRRCFVCGGKFKDYATFAAAAGLPEEEDDSSSD